MDLRDKWEKPGSPAKKAIKDLAGILGLSVDVNLQAHLLWNELSKFYTSQEVFIPNVVDVIEAWATTLQYRLEDDDEAEWADEFLNKFPAKKVDVYVEVRLWYRVEQVALG